MVGEQLYLAGGLSVGGVAKTVEIYTPAANVWRRGPDLPVALHHAMAVAWRDRFVVLGGFTTDDFSTPSARAFALAGERWTELPRMRRARGAGGAAVARGQIVVVGGSDGARLIGETERFDGKVWRDGAPIPTPRDHLGVAAVGGSVFALAGRRLSIESTLNVFERYDVARNDWVALPDARVARGGFALVAIAGRLVAVGGEGPASQAGSDGVFDDVELFHPSSRTWERIAAPMPQPRHGVGAGALEDTVFIAAGGPRAGGSYSAALDGLKLAITTRAA